MVLDVLIKNENPNICGTGGSRVKTVLDEISRLTGQGRCEDHMSPLHDDLH